MKGMQAKFITLEGIDGAGKSTHLAWLTEALRGRGMAVRVTREPGGTRLGERLRELLLDPAQTLNADTEALLMFAARSEHLAQVIRPALAAGEWVLCDRFTDATFAYQGWGRGVELTQLEALEAWVQGELQPDMTLYFDVPTEVARGRLQSARVPDRFEAEQDAFFERVRQGYLERAHRFPQRIHIIDARLTVSDIHRQLEQALSALVSL